MSLNQTALEALKTTSRTFFIPISRLPDGLQEAIGSAYLCMRAIDEIEDHATLAPVNKVKLLNTLNLILQAQTSVDRFGFDQFEQAFQPHRQELPAVTTRLGEWACYAPPSIAPRIWEATAAMSERMAYWVANNWKIVSESDLDRYTFGVAGAVGLLLCDLWAWFDGGQLDRAQAIHFGRGLQLVNILRNRVQDLARGVDFFPTGWSPQQMNAYARHNLNVADSYARTLPTGAFTNLIKIPLALANATLDSLARGETKLSRPAVHRLIQELDEKWLG